MDAALQLLLGDQMAALEPGHILDVTWWTDDAPDPALWTDVAEALPGVAAVVFRMAQAAVRAKGPSWALLELIQAAGKVLYPEEM